MGSFRANGAMGCCGVGSFLLLGWLVRPCVGSFRACGDRAGCATNGFVPVGKVVEVIGFVPRVWWLIGSGNERQF